MRIEVDSGGYTKASDAAFAANHALAANYVSFTSALSGFAAMAGTDDCGEKFAQEYDEAAAGAVAAYADLVAAAGGIGELAVASLVNHQRANRASILHPGAVVHQDGDPYPTGDIPSAVLPSSPPSALGGDGAGPDWWHWVADKLGGLLYPDADTGRLKDAGTRWHSEADAVERYAHNLRTAGAGMLGQTSPEAAVASEACRRVETQIEALADAMRDLGDVCTGFAEDVEAHRQQMEDELASFVKWTVAIQLVSHGLAVPTIGFSELGQFGQAAKIAAAVAKVRSILTALSAAVVIRLAPVARTITTVTKVSAEVRPIANAATRMARVRALGKAGENAVKIAGKKKRIASATGTAKYRIPDKFDEAAQIIGEVKNVARQGLTSQLKDFLAYAQGNPGWTFVLYVRKDTVLTGPLKALLADPKVPIVVRKVL